MKLRQINLLTPVCHSVHKGWGVGLADTPPGQTPPGSTYPPPKLIPPRNTHVPGGTSPMEAQPPGSTPPGRANPRKQTHPSTHPLGRHPPGQTPLRSTHPTPTSWKHAPLPPPPKHTTRRSLQQTGRILLDCFHVSCNFRQRFCQLIGSIAP